MKLARKAKKPTISPNRIKQPLEQLHCDLWLYLIHIGQTT